MKTRFQYLNGYLDYLKKQELTIEEILSSQSGRIDEAEAKSLLVNEVRMIRLLKPLLAFLPFGSPYVDFTGGETVFTMEEKESGVFHIVMEELLPHRFDHVFLDTTTLEEMRTRIALDYVSSLMSFEGIDSITVRDKVFIYFVNFYAKGTLPCDSDNLDPKIFIDNVVVPAFVSDDSGDKVSYAMTFSEGENTHTEVYIGAFEDVLPYMAKYSDVRPQAD